MTVDINVDRVMPCLLPFLQQQLDHISARYRGRIDNSITRAQLQADINYTIAGFKDRGPTKCEFAMYMENFLRELLG